MSLGRSWVAASLAAVLYGVLVEAAEFRHLDGVHRIAKHAATTPRAVLGERNELEYCGTSLRLCPSSLNGGCCPDNYDCAKQSCYVTTAGPSTCGGHVGWYACDAVHGGGCCPDGYACDTAGNCVPPSGSAYTYGCPASHYLCPASLSYGCCPDGLGCGVNQCYSTDPTTITTTMTMKTTQHKTVAVITTTAVRVETPTAPSSIPTQTAQSVDGLAVVKVFPTAVAKVSPFTSNISSGSGGGSSISSGEIAGIAIAGVAVVALAIIGAWIILRRLNKVAAAVGQSGKRSESSTTRPPMKQYRPTTSEVDAMSVDPLMSPRPAHARHGSSGDGGVGNHSGVTSPDLSSLGDQTPTSFGGVYQSVTPSSNGRGGIDSVGHMISYFDPLGRGSPRISDPSSLTRSHNRVSNDSRATYTHVRQWSDASEASSDKAVRISVDRSSTSPLIELEAKGLMPELAASESAAMSPGQESGIFGEDDLPSIAVRVPSTHQRKRGEGWMGRQDQADVSSRLGVVDEEIHGFHGPDDRLQGKTAIRPPTGYSTAQE